jgi:DNA ligase-1
MQFGLIVTLLSQLEKTSSRNAMTELLAEFFKEVPAEDVRQVCYLLLGQLGPLFARIDFGMAEKMVIRAIAEATQTAVEDVFVQNKERGDLGETTAQLLSSKQQAVSSMGIEEVYKKLIAIAHASGEGSQEIKVQQLSTLLQRLSPTEAKYVVRIVLGKMRLGFSDKTLLDALSVMDGGTKSGRDLLDVAYQVSPDIGTIAELVIEHGVIEGARQVELVVGTPLIPALAQRLKTPADMIAKMGKVMVDPKYDGTRTQIHFVRNQLTKTFARSLEDTSAMFPELSTISQQLNATSVVIDCEAVGINPETGALLPFQDTITRKRKHGVEALSKSIPVVFFCFDLLYLDGKSLLHLPLHERRALLDAVVIPGSVLKVAPTIVTDDVATLRSYHKQQLGAGLEGAMVKKYDGEYQPGRTGWNWVKFKEVEDAEGKLSDTIDGVVLGYYKGKGKRSNFGVGAFLLGIRNANGSYVTVAKIGTGLTDDQWRELKRRADSCFAMTPPSQVTVAAGLTPDVWTDPEIVVEVAADEITVSPLHSSGFGLRFPRLVRFRDDKRADQTTTVSELKQIQKASFQGTVD